MFLLQFASQAAEGSKNALTDFFTTQKKKKKSAKILLVSYLMLIYSFKLTFDASK